MQTHAIVYFYSMLRHCILFIAVLCATTFVQAQLQIAYNGREINYSTAGVSYALTPNNQFRDSLLQGVNENFWKPLSNNKINLIETSSTFWLKIPINTIAEYGVFDFVNINNPHINFLKYWIVCKDSIVMNYPLTGDNTTFNTRPLPAASYVYRTNSLQYKDCYIIIATDKKYTRLDVPVHFYSEAYYAKTVQGKQLLSGIFIGLGILLFVFNMYLFISLGQTLYMWYSIYLFTALIYICTDMGLLFMYVYPNIPVVNDVIRPSVFALSSFPLMFFFNKLLSIKTNFPEIFSLNRIVIIAFAVLFIVAVSSSSTGNYELQGFWVKVNRIVGPLMLLLVLGESVYCLIKRIRFAVFAVLSFGCMTFFIIIYSMHQNGLIPHNNFTSTTNYWAIMSEAFIIAFSLAWRYKLYKEDSERLLKENLEQQKNIFKETSVWQEKEMQRMSSLLHDTVGADLGFLRLETDNMPLTADGRNTIANIITRIGNDVRNMSHSFSPIILQNKGVYGAINDMVQRIRANSNIAIQFEWVGKKNTVNEQYQIIIYRIAQEILQNLLKHSKASNASLQIMIEQELVSIYAEDDGIGLQQDRSKNGIGLPSIEHLVALLKGSCRIESNEDEGFSISIEFNQPTND